MNYIVKTNAALQHWYALKLYQRRVWKRIVFRYSVNVKRSHQHAIILESFEACLFSASCIDILSRDIVLCCCHISNFYGHLRSKSRKPFSWRHASLLRFSGLRARARAWRCSRVPPAAGSAAAAVEPREKGGGERAREGEASFRGSARSRNTAAVEDPTSRDFRSRK